MGYLAAFMLLQVTMLGVFALSEGPVQSALMVPPLIVTISYAYFVIDLYESGNTFVSLAAARRFDIQNALAPTASPLQYQHPALLAPAALEPDSVDQMHLELKRLAVNQHAEPLADFFSRLRADDDEAEGVGEGKGEDNDNEAGGGGGVVGRAGAQAEESTEETLILS